MSKGQKVKLRVRVRMGESWSGDTTVHFSGCVAVFAQTRSRGLLTTRRPVMRMRLMMNMMTPMMVMMVMAG